MIEIPNDIQEKIKSKDKGFVSDILEELYTVCRSTGRSCVDCTFEYEKLDFDYGNESNIEMCPIDAALVEYKSPGGSRGKIHPWVFENIEMVYNRLQEIKSET